MKTKASISFGFIDVTAKKDSQLQASNKQEISNLNNLKQDDVEEIQYATCERNQFTLDGNFELMPENLNNICWWSNEMSNDKGIFVTPLVLTIDFSKVHSSVGLTLIFSKTNNYCNHLKIEYYDISNNLISGKEFHPTSYRAVCKDTVENYKKIVITFYSTNNPYRYLKLYKILYGSEEVFEGDNLQSANLLEEIDLIGSENSINTLDFTVHSDNDDFNLINPKGLYKLLQERQKLKVTETLLKENKVLDMGTFYLDKWQNEKNKIMKFKAIDLLGVIDKTTFYGGMYKDKTVVSVVEEIMTSAGLTNEDYEIEESLKNIKLNGYIPICSHRAALQQVTFVICAVVDCSRSDKIKIYKLSSKTEEKQISNDADIFQRTRKTEQSEIITGVSLTLHTYEDYEYLSGNDGLSEIDELGSYTLTEFGVHVLGFSEPGFGIRTTMDVATSSSSKITEDNTILQTYNCNSATINFSPDVSGEKIALSLAREAYLQKYGSTDDVYFFPDANNGYIWTITPRSKEDTSAIDWYTVDVLNKTVESQDGLFPKMTVEPKLRVNIYGYKYKHFETQFQVNATNIINKKGDNMLKVDSCYLLNKDNMNQVAENILNYYNGTYKDEFEMILKNEQVTDKVDVSTDFGQNLKGNITSLDIDLTGGFLANCKIVGKVVVEQEEEADG